jgi:Uma2 family endonuclease
MATRTRPTVDDVLRLGARGERFELIDGELVRMSPTGPEHAGIEAFVGTVLNLFVLPRRLGLVLVGEPLFRLDPASRQARAPDVAFVLRSRWLTRQRDHGAFVGSPDLAVEIVSPSDTAKAVQRKVEDWLAYGTLAVLVMFPDEERVVLWNASGAVSLRCEDELNLDPALPGFRCQVRELFPPSLEDAESEPGP